MLGDADEAQKGVTTAGTLIAMGGESAYGLSC